MIQKRDLVTCIILSIVTCGIYGIIWFVKLTDDVKNASGSTELQSGGMSFLLVLVTCGIYGFIWAYRIGKAMMDVQTKNGLPSNDNSVLYLVLQFIGLSIVTYALVQSDLNKIAEKGTV